MFEFTFGYLSSPRPDLKDGIQRTALVRTDCVYLCIFNVFLDRISIHESTTKLTSEIIKTCLAKDSKDNLSGMIRELNSTIWPRSTSTWPWIECIEIIKVIIIEFKQFPKFDPSIFHADVELDARIFSSIEDYVTELNIDELCLEDIFIQLLEGKLIAAISCLLWSGFTQLTGSKKSNIAPDNTTVIDRIDICRFMFTTQCVHRTIITQTSSVDPRWPYW